MASCRLKSRVRALLDQVSVEKVNVGLMSPAVYDTAWVSMVAKDTIDGRIWLFPECFRWVLKAQQLDGGWPAYAADIDGILNTGAALLSILKHLGSPYQLASEYSTDDLHTRVASGTDSLSKLLKSWDVAKADHVGFEILVPMILMQLEEQGITFSFPGQELLSSMNVAKLSKFKPEYLYKPISTTVLHSLEALVGKIDYDRLRHHKIFGAYMASPSSTAAVLIYGKQWDQESADYLRWAMAEGAGRGSGGMPSAFPSTYFEVTWVLTTILEAGFTVADIGQERAAAFAKFLQASLDEQKGRIGFAPSVGVDVDDTAKALLSLSLLGFPASHQGLLEEFEADTHFRTYAGERNPSFTANCNVLVALLSQPNVGSLAPQIIKIASFLNGTWWDVEDGRIADKWNLSKHYPCMLMAEAFSSLVKKWNEGLLPDIPESFIVDSITVSLYQVLVRTLTSQGSDGSWDPPFSSSITSTARREVTSYATLTICKAAILPILDPLLPKIASVVAAAKAYLDTQILYANSTPAYLWVEKVTYGSLVLTESYTLAALKSSVVPRASQHSGAAASSTSLPRSKPSVDLQSFSELCFSDSNVSALFRNPNLDTSSNADKQTDETWQIIAAELESVLFRPYLQRLVADIMPGMEDDLALEVVPFIWTACNYADRMPVTTSKLRQQMSASLLQQLITKASQRFDGEAGRAERTMERAHLSCVQALLG